MSNMGKENFALLSEFSYIDLPSELGNAINRDSANLGEVLEHLNDTYKSYLTSEQIKTVEKMLSSPDICELEFVQYDNKDSLINNKVDNIKQTGKDITGFVAMGFVSPEGNPIAVFRGSESINSKNADSHEDWLDNIKNMLLGKPSTQYKQSQEFYEKLIKMGEGQPIVVGHSKGGNLAAYIASIYGGCRGHLFNPMPLHENFVNEENFRNCDISTYVAEHDFIATLLSLVSPNQIQKLLEGLSDDEIVKLLSGDKRSIVGLVKQHPDIFSEILSKHSLGCLTENEIEILLASLSEEDLIAIISGDKLKISMIIQRTQFNSLDGLKTGLSLAMAANTLRKILKDIDKIMMKLSDFHGNFGEMIKNNNSYKYPGNVYIVNNDLNIWNMLDAHDIKNFAKDYERKIILNFNHSSDLIRRLNNINSRLESIDRKLDVLLPSVIIDYSPFNIVQNLINGFRIIINDIRIGKSKKVSNCIKWIQEVELEFKNLEASLVSKAANIQEIKSTGVSNNKTVFK